ncbi:MAG: hypothetical protein R2734_06145 [Nocardioides sp.]
MALTFDDGPSSALTPSFLTSLAKRAFPRPSSWSASGWPRRLL